MKKIQIGSKEITVPIIQGGMGVGVSLGNLAGHVALAGGMGVISTAHPGYRADDFETNCNEVNARELAVEIQKAKEISKGKGIVAINAMVALRDYANLVKAAVSAGVESIISGAGLPLNLPSFVEGTNISIAPIVSSGKAAKVILRNWTKKYNRVADFIVIEGSKAGGHLGFSKEDLLNDSTKSLEEILPEVMEAIQPFEEKYDVKIPVFVAGGIYTGKDIKKYMDLGAAGVQMATRFIATHECDASTEYKQAFLNSTKADIELVKSPVGMPGRAIMTDMTKALGKLEAGQSLPIKKCYRCLIPCDVKTTPYCISDALIKAVKGNVQEGLVFSGTNGYRNDKIIHVQELIDELMEECK